MNGLTPKLTKGLIKQSNLEFQASSCYFFKSLWFDFNHYPGSAKYFKKESKEEYEHGINLLEYVVKRNRLPSESFPVFENKPITYKVPFELFQSYLDMESENLKSLQELYMLAHDERDGLTIDFLSKYLKDQLTALNETESIYNKAKNYAKIPELYHHLDNDLKHM